MRIYVSGIQTRSPGVRGVECQNVRHNLRTRKFATAMTFVPFIDQEICL
jgi:hypothetical protein